MKFSLLRLFIAVTIVVVWAGLSVAAYLSPLNEATGALRVASSLFCPPLAGALAVMSIDIILGFSKSIEAKLRSFVENCD